MTQAVSRAWRSTLRDDWPERSYTHAHTVLINNEHEWVCKFCLDPKATCTIMGGEILQCTVLFLWKHSDLAWEEIEKEFDGLNPQLYILNLSLECHFFQIHCRSEGRYMYYYRRTFWRWIDFFFVLFCFDPNWHQKSSSKNGRRNKLIPERKPKSSLFNRQYTQNVQNSWQLWNLPTWRSCQN